MSKIMKRDDVVSALLEAEYDLIEWDTVRDILLDGCSGISNYDDTELIENYNFFFDESIAIAD